MCDVLFHFPDRSNSSVSFQVQLKKKRSRYSWDHPKDIEKCHCIQAKPSVSTSEHVVNFPSMPLPLVVMCDQAYQMSDLFLKPSPFIFPSTSPILDMVLGMKCVNGRSEESISWQERDTHWEEESWLAFCS